MPYCKRCDSVTTNPQGCTDTNCPLRLTCKPITSTEFERAVEITAQPEFWCRARLFRALRAADIKGVLHEVLDEIGIDGREEVRIINFLNHHWKDPK